MKKLIEFRNMRFDNGQGQARHDANTAFINRELNHVQAEIYKTDFPELKFRALVPVSNEVNPGAKTHSYKQYTAVGVAKIIANPADDIPMVGLYAEEFVGKVRSLALGYGYSYEDLLAAAMAGVPLAREEAIETREGIERKLNSICFLGDSDYDLPGFLTNENIPEVTIPADGSGGSSAWSAKTPLQIIRDLNLVKNAPTENTQGIEVAKKILLPLTSFTYINSTPFSDSTEVTILQWFLKNNPGITVDWLNELETAGDSSSKRMIAYNPDSRKLKFHIPKEFEQLPPQEKNLYVAIPCWARSGGVQFTKPFSAAFGDGI